MFQGSFGSAGELWGPYELQVHRRPVEVTVKTADHSGWRECPVWMAPALQGLTRCFLRFGRVQSCVRPLLMRSYMTAGPDGIRGQGPILICGL